LRSSPYAGIKGAAKDSAKQAQALHRKTKTKHHHQQNPKPCQKQGSHKPTNEKINKLSGREPGQTQRAEKHCQRISAITCVAAKQQPSHCLQANSCQVAFCYAKHLFIGYFRSAYSRCRPVQGHTDKTDGSQKHIQNRKHAHTGEPVKYSPLKSGK